MNTKTATVIVGGLVLAVVFSWVGALLLWGSQDVQTQIVEVLGGAGVGGLLLGALKWLATDKDGDGVPDVLQSGKPAEDEEE